MAVFRKVLGLALAATAAVGVNSAASAAITYAESAGPFSGTFSAQNITVGAFSHAFFSAPALNLGNGIISVQANTVANTRLGVILSGADFDFDALHGLQLLDLNTMTAVDGMLTSPALGAENEWIVDATLVGGHLYSIVVNGTSKGAASSVSGTYSFAGVPEAGTWMMMVAGFGLMGTAMRRRPRTQVTFA